MSKHQFVVERTCEGDVVSPSFNPSGYRCDTLGKELEEEQLEAEIWRFYHQQRRLYEAGPAECRAGSGLGEYSQAPSALQTWTVHDEGLVFQIHIPGHAGYHGNEQADRLSREGALKPEEQQENKWSLFNRCRWTWKRRRGLQRSLFLYFLLFQIKFEVWASFSGLPHQGFLNSGGGTCRGTGRARCFIWRGCLLKHQLSPGDRR